MAYQAWVTTSTNWCDRVNSETSMMERRVYPSEIMPDFPGYQVRARKCSLGITCNLAGFTCKWAYNELGSDPFKPAM